MLASAGRITKIAGFAYVGESVQKLGKYYRNNVVGSLTLLESMIKHRNSQDRVFVHLFNLW
jgi:UDP-glucose 4-epimerase